MRINKGKKSILYKATTLVRSIKEYLFHPPVIYINTLPGNEAGCVNLMNSVMLMSLNIGNTTC